MNREIVDLHQLLMNRNNREVIDLHRLYIEQERISATIIRLTDVIQRMETEQTEQENQRIINRMKSRRESAYILLRTVRRNILTNRIY